MATDFAAVARLLGNTCRAAMIDQLMDGTAMGAGQLARVAGVSPSTASEHLGELSKGGLIVGSRVGRRKYFTIASPDVATALEAFAAICPPTQVRSLRQSNEAQRLALLRTCYDHLAGSIAVALLETIHGLRWIRVTADGYEVTKHGEVELRAIGVDVSLARRSRRVFARACLDWTERKPHLAGALGALVAKAFFTNGWARRQEDGRGLVLTKLGRASLIDNFGSDERIKRFAHL